MLIIVTIESVTHRGATSRSQHDSILLSLKIEQKSSALPHIGTGGGKDEAIEEQILFNRPCPSLVPCLVRDLCCDRYNLTDNRLALLG